MSDKQALNATFFAFKKRDRGGVLTSTTIAYIVICILVFGLFGFLNLGALQDYITWTMSFSQSAESGTISPEAMTPPASVMALGPMMFLLQIFYYVIAAAYESACLRWMIRGEREGVFGFSFGADTWRTYFTYWIWFFLWIGFGIVFFVIFGSMTAAYLTVGAANEQPSASAGGLVWLMPILGLLVCVALVYLGVRLAPAAATSIARRRFAFFEAWKVTRGRFWALLGAFVLLFLIYIVFYLVLSMVAGVAIAMGMAGQAGLIENSNASPEQVLAAFMQPQVLIPVIVIYGALIVGAFTFMVALFGVNARAAALALEEGKITAEA